jgi:hypothetical protein
VPEPPDYFVYNNQGFAVRLANRQRLRLFADFMDFAQPGGRDKVLDLGVTADDSRDMNNYFELLYPHTARITAAGLEAKSPLPKRFKGLRYVRIRPGRLPFRDGAFDYVHSSAVIEHVGSRAQQQAFLKEAWRVCRKGLFLTTPNRWAPVEFHTVTPLLHWLPAPAFRAYLRWRGMHLYADEANLNLLDAGDLSALAAGAGLENARIHGVRLFGWPSNLCLSARKAAGPSR